MPNILDRIVLRKHQEIEAGKRSVSIKQLRSQIDSAPPPRNFLQAIRLDPNVSLIAEVKKASPSQGVIRHDFDPVAIANSYAAAGAQCISVLTDEHFFQGKLSFLSDIRDNIQLPILRKDFVVDAYQIFQARAVGADAVLLIAECLSAKKLRQLHNQIVELGMTALVEFFEPENLPAVLDTGAPLVGINNRNLKTFETDLTHCLRLRDQIPTDTTVVGESGIFTATDVLELQAANIDAMLVGESLMRSNDISSAVRKLLGLTG